MTFATTVPDPFDTEGYPVRVEVTYTMRDCGVMGRQNEDVRAVIESVVFVPKHLGKAMLGNVSLLESLPEETIAALVRQAEGRELDEDDFRAFGAEGI